MGQTISSAAVVEITSFSNLQGQSILNVFHYANTGMNIAEADGDNELRVLLTNFQDKVWNDAAAGVLKFQSDEFTRYFDKAQQVSPARNYYIAITATGAGALASPSMPSDTNLTIDLRTDAAGRGLTGNKKFTGIPHTSTVGNRYTAAALTNWGLVGAQLLLTLNDSTMAPRWRPLVWSPARSSDRRNIVGSFPNEEVRVLRRRQKGQGI